MATSPNDDAPATKRPRLDEPTPAAPPLGAVAATAGAETPPTQVQQVAAILAAAQGDLGPALKVCSGSRLEVKWTMVDDNGETEVVWWPGQVLARSGRKHALDDPEEGLAQEVPVYEIRYDPRPPEVLDYEVVPVCLTGPHELYDVDSDATMAWRFAGEDWDEPEEADNSEEEDDDLEELDTEESRANTKSAAPGDHAGDLKAAGSGQEIRSARQRASSPGPSDQSSGTADGPSAKPANVKVESSVIASLLEQLSPSELQAVRAILVKYGYEHAIPSEDADDHVVVPEGKSAQVADELVHAILGRILKAHSREFLALPANVQNAVADDVTLVKDRLISKIQTCLEQKRSLDVAAAQEIVEELQEEIRLVRLRRG